MRQLIDLMEGVLRVHVKTSTFRGDGRAELLVSENPNKKQIIQLCQKHFAMQGDANLRGFAHDRKVWVWSATDATHGQVLPALGFDVLSGDGKTALANYNSAEFCMFQLRGYGFQEGDDDPAHNHIVVWSMASVPTLKASSAGRWGCTIDTDGYY